MSTAPADVTGRIVGHSPLHIWSLPSELRIARQLARFGVGVDASPAQRTVLLRADWVYDDAIVRGLVTATDDIALVAEGGECVAINVSATRSDEAAAALNDRRTLSAVRILTPAHIADGYNDVLRKREPPFLMPLSVETLPAIERRVFGASYKGVTDLVTLYLWPAPARAVTRCCANLGITPNQVTSASLVLVLVAMWMFWTGHYGWGLLAAWPMTFLDTVDGKLARVTLQSSKWGNVFDHGIDLIHPPFWWWAWIVGLPAAFLPLVEPGFVLGVIVAGYVLQRIEEGIFIAGFGMDMHVWKRFDSRFRLITARRNPNLLLLTASVLVGRPDWGILAVAAWTVLCLLVHALRIVQATIARRHGPLRSWLAS
ncbi:MAG: CDP-alcohol phosphatidyltransferase family protein [Panacagrimonas sp.]